MQGLGLIGALIVGGLAGWIAGRMMEARQGVLVNVGIGILGAIVGNFLLTFLTGGTLGGWIGQLIVGAGGACLLIWLVRVIRRA